MNAPNLPHAQVLELLRIAASDTPCPGPTLLTSPLSYHGLIATPTTGTPMWTCTERGRRWIAANDERRATRAVTVRKVSGPQLAALRAIDAGTAGVVGNERTYAALYDRGLIDWTDTARGRWTVTEAGCQVIAAARPSNPWVQP